MRAAVTIFLTVSGTAVSVLTPIVLKKIVSMIREDSVEDHDNVLGLNVYGMIGVYGLLWTLGQTLTHIRAVTLKPVLFETGENLSSASLEHIHKLPLASHSELETHAMINMISSAQFKIGDLISDTLTNGIPTTLEIILASGVIIHLYGYSFGVSFATIMVSHLGFTTYVANWAVNAGKEAHRANEKSVTRIAESLKNYEIVKLFDSIDRELEESKIAMLNSRNSLIKVQKRDAVLRIGQGFITGAGLLVLTLLSGKKILEHEAKLVLDDFVLINAYLLQFILPLNKLGALIATIKNDSIGIKKLLNILDIPAPLLNKENIRVHNARIRFQNVTFKYNKNDSVPPVNDVSFEAEPHSVTGIIGKSGNGKSTLLKLLSRNYEPDMGDIFIDEQPISLYSKSSLRSLISVVPQEDALFSETLRYNLTYGHPNVSQELINEAVRLSCLTDLINQYGLDYKIGSNTQLSGGEKKRICIARALLKSPSPSIYVFDEPTASLDNIAANEIKKTLYELSKRATVIIITHQLTLIQEAKQILVLEKGRITGRGKHENLIEENDLYKLLHDHNKNSKNNIENHQNINQRDTYHENTNDSSNHLIAPSENLSFANYESTELKENSNDLLLTPLITKPTNSNLTSYSRFSFYASTKASDESGIPLCPLKKIRLDS